jgi:pyrroloquinoline-quinone synthase
MANATDVVTRLDAAVAARKLLDHPFYKAWVAGELSSEDLRFYSTQYWQQVESFPGYLSSLADRLPESPARKVVLENLSDEVNGDHKGLWLEFAKSVGATEAEVRETLPEPETNECVARFSEGTDSRSLAFGLGMLYGYESQTPDVAKTKAQGLRELYGIDGPGLDYFELHGELDVEHAGDLASAIAEIASDEDALRDAEAGAMAGAEAIYGLLDGVARSRSICV